MAQKRQAIARSAMALKARGVNPSAADVIELCPQASFNPDTEEPFTNKYILQVFKTLCYDKDRSSCQVLTFRTGVGGSWLFCCSWVWSCVLVAVVVSLYQYWLAITVAVRKRRTLSSTLTRNPQLVLKSWMLDSCCGRTLRIRGDTSFPCQRRPCLQHSSKPVGTGGRR